MRNCYFQKFKILFKIEQKNPDQKQNEFTYKDNQRKGDLGEEIIKVEEKIKVSSKPLKYVFHKFSLSFQTIFKISLNKSLKYYS